MRNKATTLMWTLLVLAMTSIGFAQTKTDPPNDIPFAKIVLDQNGERRVIQDRNGDLWDDMWVILNYEIMSYHRWKAEGSPEAYQREPYNAQRDILLDSDQDGVTDYQEMLARRCPWTKGPPLEPTRPLTPEELAAQAKAVAQAKVERERHWKATKEFLNLYKGEAPIDEEEEKRKRIEVEQKKLDDLHKLPQIQWYESPDSANQISHAQLTNFQTATGPNINGQGMVIGVGEGQPPLTLTHPDFGGRVSSAGYTLSNGYTSQNTWPIPHGIATAGIIASSGVSNASGKGLLPQSQVVVSPSIMNEHKESRWGVMSGLNFSAHPYSLVFWSADEVPWFDPGNVPTDRVHYLFQSRPDVTTAEPNFAGMYTSDAAFIDGACAQNDEHLYVQSASNTRMDANGGNDYALRYANGGTSGPTGEDGWFIALDSNMKLYEDKSFNWPWGAGHADGGKDSLPPMCVAKNALVAGGVTSANVPTPHSGWGPTDDGRIKPDLCALSYDVQVATSHEDHSTTPPTWHHGYNTTAGNSYSTPAIAAGGAAIAQAYKARNPNKKLKAATIKAILLATAKDVMAAGPDPQTGWGIMSAGAAINLVRSDSNSTFIREATVRPTGAGQPVRFQVKTKEGAVLPPSGSGGAAMRLKVFICWNDPAATVNVATYGTVDQNVPTLKNDLNLTVTNTNGSGQYFPVMLNNSNDSNWQTKTWGVDTKNNVEQVEVYEHGVFNVEVTPPAGMTAAQPVSIVVLGADPTYVPQVGGAAPPPPGTPPQKPSASLNRTGPEEFTITWPSVAGRSYDIETSTDLVNWTPSTYDIKASDYWTSYPIPMLGEKGFYRVIDLEDPTNPLPPVSLEEE